MHCNETPQNRQPSCCSLFAANLMLILLGTLAVATNAADYANDWRAFTDTRDPFLAAAPTLNFLSATLGDHMALQVPAWASALVPFSSGPPRADATPPAPLAVAALHPACQTPSGRPVHADL